MTDGLLPQLLQPTGLGDDFPSVKLLELARTTPKKGFISFELDQENLAYAPESIPVTTEEQLFPKTPIINITSPAEAFSDKVRYNNSHISPCKNYSTKKGLFVNEQQNCLQSFNEYSSFMTTA